MEKEKQAPFMLSVIDAIFDLLEDKFKNRPMIMIFLQMARAFLESSSVLDDLLGLLRKRGTLQIVLAAAVLWACTPFALAAPPARFSSPPQAVLASPPPASAKAAKVVPPKKKGTSKTCPCSPQCACGCNQGEICRCNLLAPAMIPLYSGGTVPLRGWPHLGGVSTWSRGCSSGT